MTWDARNLAIGAEGPKVEPSLGGIAYPAYRGLLSGEPESLKSWLAAILVVEQIRQGQNVAWVDFEQGPAMTAERFRDLGLTDSELGQILYHQPREPLSDQAREDLRDLLEQTRPTLTVFDAYAGLLSLYDGDPNSERDIERVNRRVVDVFREHGSATLILDHVVKSRDNRGRYSSGNGRKLAEVETHIGLVRVKGFGRGRTGIVRLANHKDRLGALPFPTVGELHLDSCPATGAVTWEIRPPAVPAEGQPFRPTGLMEATSRYLERKGDAASRNEIETEVKGRGAWIRVAIDLLIEEGFAAEETGAHSARLVHSIRPFREADNLVPPRPVLVPSSSWDEASSSSLDPPSLEGDEDEDAGAAA